jgi:iduronate 2-sulfatase
MNSHLSRRDLLRCGATAVLGRRALAGAQPAGPPNVLFLISDDLDCRVGCYGDPVARTPAIDGLARRGVRFERAYCQFPLCNATRSSVLSGRYPTSTGVLDNDTLLVLERGQYTLPRHFERNGYAVAEFGKIHHGPNRGIARGEPRPPKTEAWFTADDRRRQQAENPAYWETTHSPYRNLRLSDPGRYAWANEFGPLPEGDRGTDHQTADRALQSLAKLAGDGKPFFLAVGFHKPHVPLKVPKEFFDLYDPKQMPLPPDFDTEPRQLAGYPTDEFRQNIDLFAARSFSSLEAREAMRAYYACVSYLDAQVGRMLEGLSRHGVRDNTIVVLWGDHGWHLSEKGLWAKGTLFEVSARGPLIISDPRRRGARKASPRVVQYLDMYPTLVDLCGLPKPPHLQGSSLKALLDNPSAPWDRPAYTVQSRSWFLGRSVRTERWRYTEWDEGRRGAALFDHDADPHEMRNLVAAPEHKGVVEELQRLLRNGPIASLNPQ